ICLGLRFEFAVRARRVDPRYERCMPRHARFKTVPSLRGLTLAAESPILRKMDQVLVTADWLLERLNDSGVRVVDCRWVIGQSGEGRRQYEAGHILGAAHLDIEQHLSKKEGPGRHPLPGRKQFQDALSEIGVARDIRVVAYDAGGASAVRL